MKQIPKMLALLTAAAFAGQVALAQDESSSQSSSSSSGQGKQGLVRISELLNGRVSGMQGDRLGKIDELVISPKGDIHFAVLGVGGVLGIGEKMTPVPWKALNHVSHNQFTLNADKQKLQSAPTLSKDQWSQLDQPEWVSQVYSHYGLPAPEGVGGTGTGSQLDKSKSTSDEFKSDKSKSTDELKKQN